MIASFHLVRYRGRVVSPPRNLADGDGLRFWRPLNVGGDFAWLRGHPTRRALYPHLRPDFRRWAFYAVWDDEDALDAFLASSRAGRGWTRDAVESLHVRMRPTRVRGPWDGMQVLHGSERAPAGAGAVAHVTRLDLTLRGTLAMWGWAAPGVLPHLANDEEMLLGVPLVDRPYMQPATFSLWRTEADALAFARRSEGHRAAVARMRRSQRDVVQRFSSGRFEPYRCDGTWEGREPLALRG